MEKSAGNSPRKKLNLSLLIFLVCLLFSVMAWDHYFNFSDPIDQKFVSNLILAMGTLFSISAGLLVWSLESGKADAERRHQELEEAFHRLKETQDQLVQSEKLASVGRVVAGIVHELNTPLVTIAGYIKLLMRAESGGETKNHLEIIDRQAERCRKIVRDLLTYARWDKPKFKAVDLRGLIESTLAELPVEFRESRIRVEEDYPGQVPAIQADGDQLRHIFSNLLVNAWQAFNPDQKEKKIKVAVIPGHETVQIFFTDNGPGIPKANLDKIFEPFFTTKPAGKGTGLGLSLVYAIAQMHGGSIAVQSEEGKGAVFIVELPLKQATAESLDAKPSSGKRKKILIVDDEPPVLQLLSHLVDSWGYESVTASNGKEALRIAESGSEKIELIILDVNMPAPDGLETARTLEEKRPSAGIPIIFLTARADDFEENGKKPLNVRAVLRKPFDYQELHQSLVETAGRSCD